MAIPCRMPASTRPELSSGAESLKFDDFQQLCMSSCSTRRHAFMFHKKSCLPVQQEDMPSYSTGGRVFSWNQNTCTSAKNHRISPIRLQMRAPDGSMPAFDTESQSRPEKTSPGAWGPNLHKIRFEEVGGRGGSLSIWVLGQQLSLRVASNYQVSI